MMPAVLNVLLLLRLLQVVILLLLGASRSATAWNAPSCWAHQAQGPGRSRCHRSWSAPTACSARQQGTPRSFRSASSQQHHLSTRRCCGPFLLDPPRRTSCTTRLYYKAHSKTIATTASAALEVIVPGSTRRLWPLSPPSRSTTIAWILAALLVREWWSKTPGWLQDLLLWPFKKLLVKPFRKLKQRYAAIVTRKLQLTSTKTIGETKTADSTLTTGSSRSFP